MKKHRLHPAIFLADHRDEERFEYAKLYLCFSDEGAYLGVLRQASRLIANEEGVRAVSFTFGRADTKAAIPDEVSLIFNRPFLFLLTSADDLPLYAGIVNQP